MNEILIRTNKGEYNPGEEIYGVVYLNIINPTAGRGVRLSFLGYEHFLYEYTDEEEKDKDGNRYEARKDYMRTSTTLFEKEDPLMLGSYMIPFRLKLLSELPGTFHASNYDAVMKVRWVATACYSVEAEVIDSKNMKVSQCLVIYQIPPNFTPTKLPPQAVSVARRVPWLLFFKKELHVTSRLKDHWCRSGGTAKLRIIITNDTHVNVTGISIKLVRELMFMCKIGSQRRPRVDKCVVDEVDGRVLIHPEGEPVTLSQQSILNSHAEAFNRGLDNILIPLKDGNMRPVIPSVKGSHILCQYSLEVQVHLSNGTNIPLTVPLPAVLPCENPEWQRWQAPDWVSEAEVTSTEGLLSVPSNVLYSEAFSGIPGFQRL
ncbi:hypothetical protein ACJMK2_033796 [Sinanodonta woodiana]|uniref:Arrestin C-terminal-like domain-containing protein n=1 Tax=Sinanodonta woodiana TaxID=1069815 RepID=A0ABD3WT04_SINWO